MFQRILQGGQSRPEGETIDRVRVYNLITAVAFLGRRRWVYTRLAELSGAHRADRVLDVGCGGGYLARLLAARVGAGGRVTGVDASGAAVRYANRHAPGTCTFVVGAAQALDLPDASFDVVTSTLALHHVPDAERLAALAEMYRVLRPGGRLLIADFRASRRFTFPHRRTFPHRHPARGATPHGAAPNGVAARSHGRGAHHHASIPLDRFITATGFRVESTGDLAMLRYVRALRPTNP